MDLAIVAYAVAPGPGGPEGHVNARLLQALAEHWPGRVTVITGGGVPLDINGTPLSQRDGWRFFCLGETGFSTDAPFLACRIAHWARIAMLEHGRGELLAKVLNRVTYWRTGSGVKMNGWQHAASRVLGRVLDEQPDACVYSRALPFESIGCAGRWRRRRAFPWIVNINDPLPASLWPGLYRTDPYSERLTARHCRRLLPRADAFTFPCARLRDLELAAFPFMAERPLALLPHVAIPHVPVTPIPDTSQTEGHLRFAFAGTLRKSRICQELKIALDQLAVEQPETAQVLEFQFHLARPNPYAEAFIHSLPVPTVSTLGQFDAELDRRLLECHVILDIEAPQDKPLLLTKLANATALARPIWAICAPGGTAWGMVHEHGWGYASAVGDAASVLSTLRTIVDDWRAGRLARRAPSPAVVERFSPRRIVADLAAVCAAAGVARRDRQALGHEQKERP